MATRTRKYRDDAGSTLEVFEAHDGWVVAWSYYGDSGMILGEQRPVMPEDSVVANEAIRGFCKGRRGFITRRPGATVVFTKKSTAMQALRHVNAALIEWQTKATAIKRGPRPSG